MATEELQQTRSLGGGGGGGGGEMFSTISDPAADEELVEAMAKRVVECLKEPLSPTVRVGGWSGIGRRRVMDRVVAAALALRDRKRKNNNKGEENEDSSSSSSSFFCGCVRVTYKSYIEYEIRRKIEQVLGIPLLGGEITYWREICMALKWKPLVLMVDNLQEGQEQLDRRLIGIPAFVPDARGVEHPFLKLVFTNASPLWYSERYSASSLWYNGSRDADKEFEEEFGELPDDVALRMILYEARSSAMATVKEYLPEVIRRKFTSRQEEMTSMMLPSLAPLHDHLFFEMLTAECVLQCLPSSMLFFSPTFPRGCPLYYLRSEILSHPCFDNYNNNNEMMINSWEAKLLLEALSQDLRDRCLMYYRKGKGHLMNYQKGEGTFSIFPDVYHKLDASAASSFSSSSSGIMSTQFQGYLVRRSPCLKLVDMAEWSQDLTRISFANGWIQEVVLPPPSAAPASFPNLSTLILQGNGWLKVIPDDVFRYTPNLRILDLSYCSRIGTLPSSLSSLLYLRMLYLQGCTELQTIETTGLDNLEVLDLDDCPLPTLHKAAWCHMRSLKRFSFRNGLRSLEELQLSLKNVKVFDNFGYDLRSSAPTADTLQKCNISILYPKEEEEEEIRRRRTRDAHLRASDDKFPYKDIHAAAARVDDRCRIDTVEYPVVAAALADNPREKCLEINGGGGLWSLYTLSLIFRPRLLSLHNYQHAQAGIWPIPELQTCYIENCRDMEYAFSSPNNEGEDLWNLKCLETLWMSSLTKLSAICNNRFEQRNQSSFLLLKSIYIEYCPNLLVLFPVAVRLPSLEVMEIKFCARLGKLFAQHSTAAGEVVLPRLKRLRLFELPKLTSICEEEEEGHHLPLPLLQKLEVRGCWNLKNVPIFRSSDSTCGSSSSSTNDDDDVAAAASGKAVVVVRGEEGWWKNVLQGGGGFKKKTDHIDFRVGFASAVPKHIPQRWKRERRSRRRFPLTSL